MTMQLVLSIVVLLSCGLLGATEPTSHPPYILHEKRSHTPSGWDVLRRRDASSVLPLRFGLKQSNIDKLEDMLYNISHPDSANYGNHWTRAQVAQTFASSQETVEIVRGWLEGAGFGLDRVKLAPSRNWLEVNTTVEEAEHLLKTEYHVYGHKSGKLHTGAYTLSWARLQILTCNTWQSQRAANTIYLTTFRNMWT
jgi:tripeptidyl-peptidase-1